MWFGGLLRTFLAFLKPTEKLSGKYEGFVSVIVAQTT